MQTNALSPAYPITPLQDNFGRMVVPVAGLSKLEYFTLEIFKIYLDKKDYIKTIVFLNLIEKQHKNISNEKDSVLDII